MDFFSRCQFLLPTLVSLLFSLDLLGASIDFESRFDLYDKLNQVVQTEGVERIKFMGHYLGLSGELEGIKLTGAPSSSRLPSLSLACALQAFGTCELFPFLSLGEENRESLERALIFVFYKPSAEEIVRHIQTRPITFVPTGWIGHRVTIAFCGDYMALCNRGGHPERPSLEMFRIDLEKVTPQIIETILEQESLGPMESGPFLYRTLPSLLSPSDSPEQDCICKYLATIAPKPQKVGVCALTSPKAAIRFAWAMLLGNSVEAFEQARLESKLFTDWAASSFYFPSEEVPEEILEGRAFEQAIKKRYRAEMTWLHLSFTKKAQEQSHMSSNLPE